MNRKLTFIPLFLLILFAGCTLPKEEKELTAQELLKRGLVDEAKGKFQITTDINEIDEDGNTVLHLASMLDDQDLVTYFLIKGANPELQNYAGQTPLHLAIEYKAYHAAEVLAATKKTLFARDSSGIMALTRGLESDEAFYDIFISEKTGSLLDNEGKSILHHFVQTKNLKAVKAVISKGLPISFRDNAGKTPLDYAFENINDYTSVEIAAELIMSGAEEVETDFTYFQNALSSRNINARFDDGQTSLHLSAIHGHNAIAKYLLANKADTSVQDSSGATPLHEAVRYGHLEIATMLLDAGANVNAKDNLGKTPILLIIPQDKIQQTYDLLIANHADLNMKDMYGDTILHTAAMLKVNVKMLEKLTSNGADINARNKEGVTPLEIAIQQGDVETTKLFTTHGANIHTKDTNGNSPLTVALTSDNDIFEATVNEMNINTQDSEGNTPLHIAILNNAALAKIQYIVSLTEDVNIRNRDGNSALYLAILKNRQKVGEMLLEKNADIFSTNTNNNSPLRLALKNGGTVQDWLITSKTIRSTDGSGNTVLHYAAEWQYDNAITSLLTKGADINVKNANGETCLFSAVKTNNPDIIQLVVDGGASIKERDNLGSTPLHAAVRWDAIASMEKLIALGININAQNSAGKSPLAEAVLSGKYDVSKYLLEHHADVNCSDRNGVTILMDTIRGKNVDLVKLLIDYGANPNLQEINGRNSYHEAAVTGDIKIITIIRDAGVNPLSRDKQGNTPLSIALKRDINTIKAVLGKNYNITDSDGNSPIHIIVKSKCSAELLETLIKEGYPIDTRNADGYTPLNYAIEADDTALALILLEHGANPFQTIDKKGTNGVTMALERNNKQMISNIVKYANSMTDIQGNTILHYAAKTSSVETVKSLLSYGIDRNVKNVSGDTPYTIAVRWKRPEIAELLNPAQKD